MEFTQPSLLDPLEAPVIPQPGLQCEICGTPIRRPPPSKRARGEGRYCSRACQGIAKRLPHSLTADGGATELHCTRCKMLKPVDYFYRSSNRGTSRRGRQYWCIPCAKAARGPYVPPDPVTVRRNRLREYGITMEDYDALFEAQDGRCAICGIQKEPWQAGLGLPGRDRFLVVDHDHADGHFRGLLCRNCNNGLGHFRDDVSILLSAVAYIRQDVELRVS